MDMGAATVLVAIVACIQALGIAYFTSKQHSNHEEAVGVAAVAKRHGVPVVCLSGGLGDGADDVLAHGIDALAATVPQPMTLEACMGQGADLVEAAAARTCRLLKVGMALRA